MSGQGAELARMLFLYGTLMKHVARGYPARLVACLGDGQTATVRGALYAVRDGRVAYPALVARGLTRVKGVLYPLPEAAEWLARLDRFENYDPRRPNGGEYVRRVLDVRLASGDVVRAKAYVYRRPLQPGMQRIAHGDFARYLAETGLKPYAR